jgi:hypothetical protein
VCGEQGVKSSVRAVQRITLEKTRGSAKRTVQKIIIIIPWKNNLLAGQKMDWSCVSNGILFPL